jgi:acyl-CoA reductase-like NAD-dependent aldehyde dehydrogenase
VLKASEQSPRTHHSLAQLLHKAGLPPGVFNVIQTRREDAAAVSEILISHRHIQKIEFIGSAGVGSRLGALAGRYLKPILMELGGNAVALVLDDADLELAAQGCVHGGYTHNGQTCFSTERIIVNAAVVEKFIPILIKAVASFPVFGAIFAAGSQHSLRLLMKALTKGAEILYGEVKLLEPAKLQPIVLNGLRPDMEIYDNESFGPVLAVFTVETDEEATALVNSSNMGLALESTGKILAELSKLPVGSRLVRRT